MAHSLVGKTCQDRDSQPLLCAVGFDFPLGNQSRRLMGKLVFKNLVGNLIFSEWGLSAGAIGASGKAVTGALTYIMLLVSLYVRL